MACEHKFELRKRLVGKGFVFGQQCLRCGKWQALKADSIPARDRDAAKPYDESVREEHYQREMDALNKAHREKRESTNRRWWAAYAVYLKTDTWKRRRKAVLLRSPRCEALLECDGAPATQAHHTTYKHVGAEPLWELQSVCEACHEAITALDRETPPETTDSFESPSVLLDIRRMGRAK
jgi:5-methylcytosine-specific restriction endonuclease McrA